MNVIILAAGMSTRLKEFTKDKPKCLLQVGNKPIINHQLDILTQFSAINKIIIVTGYMNEIVKSKIGNCYNGKPIIYIDNLLYESTEMNYSFYLTKEIITKSPFLYITADTLFNKEILYRLLNNENVNCIAVDGKMQSTKVDAIITGKKGVVENLIACIHGDLSNNVDSIPNIVGEPLMMIRFSSKYARYIIEAIEKEGAKTLNKHLMYIFSDIFKTNKIFYQEITGLPWIEIDNKDDLIKANEIVDSLNIC